MARRLVEAGVTFVTVDMPHWDDHSSIEKAHGAKVPVVDRAVGGLIDDLDERGLLDRVMVVVMGEFGRTPRINTGQPGIPVPGRDHWGNAISALMAGGGTAGRCGGRQDEREGRTSGRTGDETRGPPGDDLSSTRHRCDPDVQGPHRPPAPDPR